MAQYDYITYADITNTAILRFPQASIDPYILEANDEIEDVCYDLGVEPDDIKQPIISDLKRYGKNYVLLRFAEDRKNGSQPSYNEDDSYSDWFETAMKRKKAIALQLTPEKVMGTAGADRAKRAISFGRIRRSS